MYSAHYYSMQIIIHGTGEATNHLLSFAKKTLAISDDKLFAPGVGECVDATTESHIYQVSISHSNNLAPLSFVGFITIDFIVFIYISWGVH